MTPLRLAISVGSVGAAFLFAMSLIRPSFTPQPHAPSHPPPQPSFPLPTPSPSAHSRSAQQQEPSVQQPLLTPPPHLLSATTSPIQPPAYATSLLRHSPTPPIPPFVPLRNPVVWHVPPEGGVAPDPPTPDADLLILPHPSGLPTFAPVMVRGYRTVAAVGITMRPTPADRATRAARAALTIVRTVPGMVWIASSTIDTRDAGIGGIVAVGEEGGAPSRLIVSSSTIRVRENRGYGALSWRGVWERIEVNDSFIESNRWGLRLAPHTKSDHLTTASLERVRLRRSHRALQQAALLEIWTPVGAPLKGTRLREVIVERQQGVPLGELVLPNHLAPPPHTLVTTRTTTGREAGVWLFTTPTGHPVVRGVVWYDTSPAIHQSLP